MTLLLALILASGLTADYAPHPTKPGHALLHYATGASVGAWSLFRCGPRDGACAVMATGRGAGKGEVTGRGCFWQRW